MTAADDVVAAIQELAAVGLGVEARLRILAAVLPSDGSVTFSKQGLDVLLDDKNQKQSNNQR